MHPVTVGELRKILKDVPDDYTLTISLEAVVVVDVEVDHTTKEVDFLY